MKYSRVRVKQSDLIVETKIPEENRMVLVKLLTGAKQAHAHNFIPPSEYTFTQGTDQNPDYSVPLSDLYVCGLVPCSEHS